MYTLGVYDIGINIISPLGCYEEYHRVCAHSVFTILGIIPSTTLDIMKNIKGVYTQGIYDIRSDIISPLGY